jgi:peptidoglycan/LPS O-acetylase OafA/YrhL
MTNFNSHAIAYRRDIDGLRAIAIGVVLVFHAFPQYFPGGFIGVDIFFVISGFLITSILYRDIQLGQFHLFDFYARRVRRIFPALILVLFATLLFGWVVLIASEFKDLARHVVAGTLFLSNFALWQDTGYFDSAAELKPLLHLWSLGIEEQFYLFWPLILFALVKAKKHTMFLFLLALVSLSFSLNIYWLSENPSDVFYLPFTRFWELWIGAAAAIYWEPITQRIKGFEEYLFIIGLSLIGTALCFLNKEILFPGWWALLPSLGAVLIIISNAKSRLRFLLTNQFCVGLGLISYPLYLWHWPILSYLNIMEGGAPPSFLILTGLILATILATLTYLFIEKNIRKSPRKFITFILLLLMLLVGLIGYIIHKKDGFESRYKKIIQLEESYKNDFMKWEDTRLVPSIDCGQAFYFPKWKVCLQTNSNKPTVALIGDSHAFHAYWGISSSLKDAENVILLGRGACVPFVDLSLPPDYEKCSDVINQSLQYVLSQDSIKTVIFTHRYAYIGPTSSPVQIDAFKESADKTFSQLRAAGKKVIYIKSVPEPGVNPRLCVGELPFGRNSPKDACQFLHQSDLSLQKKYRSVIDEVLVRNKQVTVLDPRDFLCESNECLLVRDGKVMFMDENHISYSGSLFLGKKLAPYLKPVNMKPSS